MEVEKHQHGSEGPIGGQVAAPAPGMNNPGGISFSAALFALKDGARVGRSGWNGKGMFLFVVGEGTMEHPVTGHIAAGPYIAMKTAQQNVVPWLASQTDLLSDDWQILS